MTHDSSPIFLRYFPFHFRWRYADNRWRCQLGTVLHLDDLLPLGLCDVKRGLLGVHALPGPIPQLHQTHHWSCHQCVCVDRLKRRKTSIRRGRKQLIQSCTNEDTDCSWWYQGWSPWRTCSWLKMLPPCCVDESCCFFLFDNGIMFACGHSVCLSSVQVCYP